MLIQTPIGELKITQTKDSCKKEGNMFLQKIMANKEMDMRK